MQKIKVITIFGTRPEAIKMCPLVHALSKSNEIELKVVITAQHREMLDQVLETFDVKADYDLNIMKKSQGLEHIFTSVLTGVKEILADEKPDIILVHGDTATTFASALAGFYQKVKVGHVEAGLRTYDKYSPFPEEMNRVLTGKIADLHFAPTQLNYDNLIKENISPDNIFITGNTVIDAIFTMLKDNYVFKDDKINSIIKSGKKILLLTSHRRENLGEPMKECFSAMREIADKYNDVHIVYPIHLNPAVREIAKPILLNHDRISLVEPLEYQEFINLMRVSHIIFTDSGGIQEEAPALDVPVIVLRTETERPEGLKAGTLLLGGVKKADIVDKATLLLENQAEYDKIKNAQNPYGDGKASERIVDAIVNHFIGN